MFYKSDNTYKRVLQISLFFFRPRFCRSICIVAIAAISTLASPQTYAASLTLAWDPVDDLADGFMLYYGTESGYYTGVIDVGDAIDYTVFGLESDQTYYFAVTAYNTFGESDFSEELVTYPPYFCEADLDMDGDVDGQDLIFMITNSMAWELTAFRTEYGRTDCP